MIPYPPIPSENNPYYDEQKEMIENLSYKRKEICVSNVEIPRKALQIYTLVLTMPESAIEKCLDMRSENNGTFNHGIINDCFFRDNSMVDRVKATQIFIDHIRNILNNYPTTFEQDKELLESGEMVQKMKNIIAFRMSQKRVLQETLTALIDLLKEHGEKYQNLETNKQVLVDNFNKWFSSFNTKNNVKAKIINGKIGLVATKDIPTDGIITEVPKDLIMDHISARTSENGLIYETIKRDFPSDDTDHDLALFLMYYYFIYIVMKSF